MSQTDIDIKINELKRMVGIIGGLRKNEFSVRNEIAERVVADLDIKKFLRYFFLPSTVSLPPEKEKTLIDYMANELTLLKQGHELADRRNIIEELLESADLKRKIEDFVKEGCGLILLLEKRGEAISAGEWRKDLIYFSEEKTKEFIRIDYQILKTYILIVEIIKKIESKTDFLKDLERMESQIRQNEYYQHSRETIEQMDKFGEARLCVLYDYFQKVQDVSSIKFEPKEKRIKETLGWYLKKRKNPLSLSLRFGASQEEKFYAKALDFLVVKNLDQINEVLTYVEKLEFFLGGLRYIEKIKSVRLPLVFPSFEREQGFVFEELSNPCLLLQEGIKIISNDVQFDPRSNVAVITGPNNSGKTVYVKSIGLAYCLAQNGLSVPAKVAQLSELKDIITHFVSPGDIAKGEGMFLDELRRIRELFLKAEEKSLLIVDEPIRGSSFEDAEEMTLRFIRGFLLLGAPTFLTTHLHPVAEKVDSWQGIKNFRTEIDKDRKPTYKIIPGREKSYGVEIADKLGLTIEDILGLILIRKKKQK